MSFQPPFAELYLQQKEYKTNQQTQRISTVRSQIKSEREINNSSVNPEKPDVPLNKNDAFQKVQKRRVQEKR